jgi:hypothetical protein
MQAAGIQQFDAPPDLLFGVAHCLAGCRLLTHGSAGDKFLRPTNMRRSRRRPIRTMPAPIAATVSAPPVILLRKHDRISFVIAIPRQQLTLRRPPLSHETLPTNLRFPRNRLQTTTAKTPRFQQFTEQPVQRRRRQNRPFAPTPPLVTLPSFETALIRPSAHRAMRQSRAKGLAL